MSSDSWYRNAQWNAEVAATFDAKLARSRSQKAQYLRIQGSILKDSHPQVAIALLRRCIDEGDASHIAHALLDTAHAHYATGNIEAALDLLEAAIQQQVHEPMFRTSAAYDYAMLVALHESADRYDKALAVLERADDPPFATMLFQAEAARAVIYSSRGMVEQARRAGRNAMAAREVRTGWIPGHPDVGVIPEGDDPLSKRVRAIVDACH